MDVPDFACVLTTGGGLVFNGDPGKLQAQEKPNLNGRPCPFLEKQCAIATARMAPAAW